MDITFATDKGRFNYRVAGIIINDNRLLVIREEHSPYAYLPGSRVQFGETLESAINREIEEEVGLESITLRPLWLSQSFFY
ncbi:MULTISPECIES: NUDIX domain-containing protein [unclassified Streptococcus]|uniref:NUDIX domain-containing protein n=1 Tax=unclassified Streptococcus TaxID=2608887 RepID=UPI000A57DF93|nr:MULTISPECIES: NUDIX domain-containing protein [unclassified Streptococcus]